MTRALASIVVMLFACGDNVVSCEQHGSIQVTGCRAALLFAARDTAGLLPLQAEVDRYFERWRRVIAAEPILTNSAPQMYRVKGGFTIYTTNPRLIAAWTDSVLETGDAELDDMLAQIGASLIAPARDAGAYHRAGFAFTHLFNEEFLAAALLERSSWMAPPEPWPSGDGTWVWLDTSEPTGHDDATAQIDFRFGWGDCLSGCIGFRDLQAIVPADGPATVYDLGGNELPPGWSLSPNTKPPP